MIRYIQHCPGWADIAELRTGEVESLEELVGLDFIKRWGDKPNFKNWAIANNGPDSTHLIVEFTTSHWVLARLIGDVQCSDKFPAWVYIPPAVESFANISDTLPLSPPIPLDDLVKLPGVAFARRCK